MIWWDTIVQALIYTPLAIGVTISFRIIKFPDLTVDASFAAGGCLTAMLILKGYSGISLIGGSIAGMFAGFLTALLYTKGKISNILSGFLIIFIYYSINLFFFTGQKGNVTFLDKGKLLDNPVSFFANLPIGLIPSLIILITFIVLILTYFFRTERGLFFISSGQNPKIIADLGKSNNRYTVGGLILSNGLIGLSGGLFASKSGYGDVDMGTGHLLIGLAILVLGQVLSLIAKFFAKKMNRQYEMNIIISAIIGIFAYQFLITVSFNFFGFPAEFQKMLIAFIIILPILAIRLFSWLVKMEFQIEDLL